VTLVLAVVLVAVVAAFILSPFFTESSERAEDRRPARDELWKREKAVAVLAITEADFDLATGKLSDDDYRVLRSDYEGRALVAMDELDKLVPAEKHDSDVKFCGGCGARFAAIDSFCGACGRPRFERDQ
jgi:hypothetical protein